jgi:hypothetical protein
MSTPMPESRPALVALMALDPIVYGYVREWDDCLSDSIIHLPGERRLSEVVADRGWSAAMDLPEVKRLVAAYEEWAA